MNRRSFLTRSALVLPALLVGDEALEAFARLTHVRKTFPSADTGGIPGWITAREIEEGGRLDLDVSHEVYRASVRTGLPEVSWRIVNGTEYRRPMRYQSSILDSVEWSEL